MKQYVIDELRPEDAQQLKNYFSELHGPAIFDNIYWIPLDPELYSELQKMHTECHPFYFAVELKPDALCCELLVRTNNRIRCDCIAPATQEQRNWLIDLIDGIFDRLKITS